MRREIVITRFNEDLSWTEEYKYLCPIVVYNRGEEMDKPTIPVENLGGNQRDICKYIVDNYDDLPSVVTFLQGNPFDHCKKEIFDKLIYRETFTSFDYYGNIPNSGWERRTEEGGYIEVNNSWYIQSHNQFKNQTCRYSSFDEFMNTYFHYEHLEWIRFAPGSQYTVTQSSIYFYPKEMWERLYNELNSFSPTEGHILERAFWHIFNNTYRYK